MTLCKCKHLKKQFITHNEKGKWLECLSCDELFFVTCRGFEAKVFNGNTETGAGLR